MKFGELSYPGLGFDNPGNKGRYRLGATLKELRGPHQFPMGVATPSELR